MLQYAKYYGYGSQFAAPTQQLYEDEYRNDGQDSEAKAETQLYYKQRVIARCCCSDRGFAPRTSVPDSDCGVLIS